jgi:hypothetical protein
MLRNSFLLFAILAAAGATLDKPSYWSVRKTGSPERMQLFVKDLVRAFGGRIADSTMHQNFSQAYLALDKTYDDMVAAIASHPTWATWDQFASCVASRDASSDVLGSAVGYACSKMKYFKCENVPADCNRVLLNKADYVFSIFYEEWGGRPYPACFLNGAAIFQPVAAYGVGARHSDRCVISKDPEKTPLTDEGYQAIIKQNISAKNAVFIRRVAADRLAGPIVNTTQLNEWSAKPPKDLQSLLQWLPALSKNTGVQTELSPATGWKSCSAVIAMLVFSKVAAVM